MARWNAHTAPAAVGPAFRGVSIWSVTKFILGAEQPVDLKKLNVVPAKSSTSTIPMDFGENLNRLTLAVRASYHTNLDPGTCTVRLGPDDSAVSDKRFTFRCTPDYGSTLRAETTIFGR